ncbi:TPA: hypothetical protein N0F65_005731 [Lagenidium giganteum]|uniref:Glutamate carboxypeptidase n=1 Tax=Lagenidium giganteum TaxID=4803 RepID=A0AAV2ZC04_9STRA|nr:TPA: hypothetical protein N0F65_005731 [Lagenidium giganteum]
MPNKSLVPQADDDAVAYGTFSQSGAGRQLGSSHSMRHGAIKVVAVLGAMAVGASFMISQSQSQPRISELLRHTQSLQAANSTSDLEQQFMDSVDRAQLRDFLHYYAESPHRAGTPRDKATAETLRDQLESFGIQAEIKEYFTLLSEPRSQRVAIVEPASAARELDFTEAQVAGDACTSDPDTVQPFLAYSASGNVTSAIVYANHGTLEDFEWLEAQNIDLKGKIALVRYNVNFRGLKVMLAEQHGMAGVLLYSDPSDDGFVKGATYPDGPWRPEGSFQRGSIQYNSLYAGDPLTEGYASKKDGPFTPIEDAKSIPHIPATVLSYGQAKYILETLSGTRAPDDWQGGLELENGYNIGDDGATIVEMNLDIDNFRGTIWDVIGTIPGEVDPNQQVIVGNHRDAWVCGAVDPTSGTAVLMELARNLGGLLASGWRPRRTIVLASWDGEEYGLLGSTEYGEEFGDILAAQTVAYINVDNVKGPLVAAAGTPSIAEFLHQTARAVPPNKFDGEPTEFASLYDQWVDQVSAGVVSQTGGALRTLGPDHLIMLLGSGTDFTVFYQHLGIISADLTFVIPHGMYGVYHSTMDSIAYMEAFGDPHYASLATMTKWWGLLTLRLADSAILPFDFTTYAGVMNQVLDELEQQILAAGLTVELSELRGAINAFGTAANDLHARISNYLDGGSDENDGVDSSIVWNAHLVGVERQLLLDSGLPHRPWFKHVVFGPGYFEGYAGTAFPGIADGLAFRDSQEDVQAHVDDVAAVILAAAAYLAV